MNILALIFFVLFCIIIVATYIAIRRGLMRAQVAGSLCAAASVAVLFAFGLAQGLFVGHALFAALVVGLVFSSAAVLMAAFFRVNEPSALEAYLPDDRSLQK
ncbi:MAG: hypothetical protein HC915_19685 [Anaerolineae bacterium]|nr:hypothetical protein [Anaerolineae bacterium]